MPTPRGARNRQKRNRGHNGIQSKRRIRFQQRHGRVRSGYTLVFCVLMQFGLMGLAALVIDLGMVRVAQRQVQTAADAAALEGLRYRDMPRDWLAAPQQMELLSFLESELGPLPADGRPKWLAWRDVARRLLASRVVTWTFDDNLDPLDGDPMQHGAGPILHLDDSQHGDPSLDASRLIDLVESGVYKPQLQLNLENVQHGDIVAGSYSARPRPERDDYSRDDFTIDPSADSLLVRLRRTNDFLGLDNQPGVSSAGQSLPLLFGRGGLTPARVPTDGYSLRHHGFTVRATAIADARPALTVGPMLPSGEGAATFGITSATISDLAAGQSRPVAFVADGSADPPSNDPLAFAFVLSDATQPGVVAFAQRIEAIAGNAPADGNHVVPLLFADSDQWWIVGFAFVEISNSGESQFTLTNRRELRHVQHENASAVLLSPVGPDVRSNPELFGRLWAEHSRLCASGKLLLAPALAR